MAINFPGSVDDLNIVTDNPDVVPLSMADVAGGPATRAHAQHHKDLGEAVVRLENMSLHYAHDHSGDNSTTNKPGLHNGNKLKQANTHELPDTDSGSSSLHHTLGNGQYQAAPGKSTSDALASMQTSIAAIEAIMGYSNFRVFDTRDQMIDWNRNASDSQTSLSKPVLCYCKDTDALYLSLAKNITPAVISAGNPIGTIIMSASSSIGTHYLICDGSSYSKTTYPILFNAIGYSFGGSGDYFNVPDMKRKSPVGRDVSESDFAVRGREVGSQTHSHNEGDLAAAIGAVSSDANMLGYQSGSVHARGPKITTKYTLKTTAQNQDARSFNHHTRVYGSTAEASSYQPGVVVDFYIRAV